jgi:hypothetical protein
MCISIYTNTHTFICVHIDITDVVSCIFTYLVNYFAFLLIYVDFDLAYIMNIYIYDTVTV